ncbi:MAG: XdhC family protein [Candidatus Omnitrophica bacterium]|nr:XdhC family protein [Candidatus Omnitrophota bacterium]
MSTMNHPIEYYRLLLEAIESNRPFAVATVLKAEGSTPQKTGVKALIDQTGVIQGTIGGGLVEAEAIRRAKEAIVSQLPCLFDFPLNDPYAREAGPICGGKMRILIDPTAWKDKEAFVQILEALSRRLRGVMVTSIRQHIEIETKIEWRPIDSFSEANSLPDSKILKDCLKQWTSMYWTHEAEDPAEWTERLIDPVVPPPRLVVVGGGHVGQALATQAIWNGFEVLVIEDRPEFTDPSLFPNGVVIARGEAADRLRQLEIDLQTYIALVNRGHKQDAQCLEICLRSEAAYVGMIGSARKVAMIRKDFLEQGLASESEFDRIFAPIGLDIGSITPAEIATSIMAQIISVRRTGGSDRMPMGKACR